MKTLNMYNYFSVRLLIIIIFILLIHTGQSQNNEYLNLKAGKTGNREFRIKFNGNRSISFSKIIKINNDTCFVFQKQINNMLYVYDISKQKLDSIKVPKPNMHEIHFLKYNNDSTFTIAFEMYYDDGDSTFLFDINFKGQVLKKHLLKYNDLNDKEYYVASTSSQLIGNKWYFLIKDREVNNVDYKFVEYNIDNDVYNVIDYKYPYFDFNKLDGDYQYPGSALLKDSNISVNYSYRSGITSLNTKTNELMQIKTENSYLDTNFLYSNTYTKYKGNYWRLDYFPSLNIYRRWIVLGFDYAKKEMFIYYDTLFNVIGYQFVPKDFIIEDNGIYYSFKNYNKNEIILKIYPKLEIESIRKEDLEVQMQEIFNKYNTICTINHFDPHIKYNKFIELLSDSIKDKNFNLLVISGTSCPACNIDVYNMILINEPFFMLHPKHPMYVLLLDTANVFYSYKDQFMMQNHIFVDRDNYYEVLFSYKLNINPIILTVRKRKVKNIVPFDVEDERNSKFLKAMYDF